VVALQSSVKPFHFASFLPEASYPVEVALMDSEEPFLPEASYPVEVASMDLEASFLLLEASFRLAPFLFEASFHFVIALPSLVASFHCWVALELLKMEDMAAPFQMDSVDISIDFEIHPIAAFEIG
jgi:hypothetical protein